MRISEVIPGDWEAHKRVGIHFPDRIAAVKAAVHLFREHGIDPFVVRSSVYVEEPRVIAQHYQGIFELASGTRGWNEWEPTTLDPDHYERLRPE